MNISKCSRWKVKHSFQGSKFLLRSSYVSYQCDMTKTIYRLFQHQGSTLTWKTIGVVTKAWFRHQSFHELNLIPWIKYMKRLVSESIWNGYFNLEWLTRSSPLAWLRILPLEWVWSIFYTFHVLILMHKLL